VSRFHGIRDERGQTFVEYAVILVMIAALVLAGWTTEEDRCGARRTSAIVIQNFKAFFHRIRKKLRRKKK